MKLLSAKTLPVLIGALIMMIGALILIGFNLAFMSGMEIPYQFELSMYGTLMFVIGLMIVIIYAVKNGRRKR